MDARNKIINLQLNGAAILLFKVPQPNISIAYLIRYCARPQNAISAFSTTHHAGRPQCVPKRAKWGPPTKEAPEKKSLYQMHSW